MNKTKRILIFTMIVLFMSIPPLIANEDEKRESFHCLVSNIMKKLKTTYDLSASAIGSANVNGIKEINLGFFKNSPMTKSECRVLMMRCINDFVEIVHSDKDAKKYQLAYPDTLDHISVSIRFANEDGSAVVHPEINGVIFVNRTLHYTTFDPENPFQAKDKVYEKYEEAQMIVNKKEG